MIAVTGGTGVVGSALVKRLHAAGSKVRVIAHPSDANANRVEGAATDVWFCDIADPEALHNAFDGVDTVYHLAAVIIAKHDAVYDDVNVGGTRNCVEEAQKARVKHFVYVSSASVVYPKSTPYSRSKQRAEDLVKRSGLETTIARPTLVYDRRGGQEFDLFLDYLKRFPVVPFIGDGSALKRPVYAQDLVDGLARMHDNRMTYGRTYNLSGAQAVTMMQFARQCLRLLGMERKPVVCLPVGLCTALARVMARLMRDPPLRWPVIAGVTQDANLDPADAMRELGYSPMRVGDMLPACFPREP